MLRLYTQLHHAPHTLVTGRPEALRKVTNEWFNQHDAPYPNILLMRPDNCRIPDYEYKAQTITPLSPSVIFEDNERCVASLRALGFFTLHVTI